MRLRPAELVLQTLNATGGSVPLATVSGVLTTRPGLMHWADVALPEIEIITTKSYQITPNAGYREPILCEPEPGCFGNAVGLANPGMDQGLAELRALRESYDFRALLNVSIAGSSTEEFATLAKGFGSVADLLELNLSCPHARDGYGIQAAPDADSVGRIVSAVRAVTDRPVLAKLSPNNDEIGEQAVAAIRAGADGLVAINTVGPHMYQDPATGTPLLSNPGGGGRSGLWVRTIAAHRVAAIRSAVGPNIPIVGMGGVASASDARGLRDAGATVIGLGSVLARLPNQEIISRYVSDLARDLTDGGAKADRHLQASGGMEYQRYAISDVEIFSRDLAVFVLDGHLPYSASQYAFLLVPGGGEKPFSILSTDPLRFLVRRRGPMTQALFDCRPGDEILMRGPYGSPAPMPAGTRSVVVAGGTGCAVVPALVEQLIGVGQPPHVFLGVAEPSEVRIAELVSGVPVTCVADRGQVARVLDRLPHQRDALAGVTVYAIGPVPFMQRVVEIGAGAGAASDSIFASLETPTRCGVGICGACEVGGGLLCRRGTFVDASTIEQTGWPADTH